MNYANDTLKCSYRDIDSLSAQNDLHYVPYESDISIQNPGDAWFYHKGHVFDSASNLWQKYLAVVGRGSHFIINVPPNRSGLIVDEFVSSVAGRSTTENQQHPIIQIRSCTFHVIHGS